MPTQKKRINMTPPEDLYNALESLAERDGKSVSFKAVELIQMAIEIDEDDILNAIAEERDRGDAKFISHDEAWQ